ncbi:MAG: exo-alpha-sialidase [Methylococcales bacterium]|nr:exo-alpha-sialidase [Methylococcales bacterium]
MCRISYFFPLIMSVTLLLTACVNRQSVVPDNMTTDLTASSGLQEVISFDVTAHDDKIHALVTGKSADKTKRTVVRYLFSEDGGQQWRSAVDVATDSNPIAVRGNDVQIAATGDHLVAIWQTKGEFPSMGPMVSYYSHDAGKTWHKGANPAVDNNGDQAHIDVIADKQGIFHAVWLADPEENGYQSLRYARSTDMGEHWQASQKLDDSTCSCCWNTFAVSPSGELNILYRDMKPRDMALMQSSDNGVTWRRTSTVGTFGWQFEGCPHIGGGLAVGENNALYSSVWTGLEGKSGLYTLHSGDNGRTWSTPQAMGKLASHGDIAVNQQHLAMIWDEREPDGMSIFSAQSQDGGVIWSTAKRLSVTGIMATHPRIISTQHGFLALWTEKHPKQPNQWMVKMLEE